MLAFFIMFQKTDSFTFRLWRQAWVSPGVKNLVFLLVFIGFGAKAGMVPLHFWAPGGVQCGARPCVSINVRCNEENRHLWNPAYQRGSAGGTSLVVGFHIVVIWCYFGDRGLILCPGGTGY